MTGSPADTTHKDLGGFVQYNTFVSNGKSYRYIGQFVSSRYCFDFSADENGTPCMNYYGFGHGVGMSQCGMVGYAQEQGMGYRDITLCSQLKLRSADGKRYLTDVATTEQLFRLIQSVPSPKAEPFKIWLAQVGRERVEETIDPELTIDRALETYQKKGYSTDWIHQRLLSIRVRNELTAEWQARGVEQGREYAILTDEITKAWSGMTTRQYKNLKGLKKENLRDNMYTDTVSTAATCNTA